MPEIYTWKPEPFMHGGVGRFVKTEIEEYSRVKLAEGVYGLVFRHPKLKQWHVASEDCGALVQHARTKDGAISQAKKDIATGDMDVLKEQIKKGKEDCAQATMMPYKEFFSMLKGD